MQEVHPNSTYVSFLGELKTKEEGVYLIAPDEKYLLSYMYHCRDTDDSRTEGVVGRSNKGSNIRKKLNFISGTLLEFEHAKLHRTKKMTELIKKWEGEDDVARALSFLPEEILPKAWKALWRLKISDKNKRRLWSRFLVQFALVARSSDVAGEYCPLMENVSFPTDAKGNILFLHRPNYRHCCYLILFRLPKSNSIFCSGTASIQWYLQFGRGQCLEYGVNSLGASGR